MGMEVAASPAGALPITVVGALNAVPTSPPPPGLSKQTPQAGAAVDTDQAVLFWQATGAEEPSEQASSAGRSSLLLDSAPSPFPAKPIPLPHPLPVGSLCTGVGVGACPAQQQQPADGILAEVKTMEIR